MTGCVVVPLMPELSLVYQEHLCALSCLILSHRTEGAVVSIIFLTSQGGKGGDAHCSCRRQSDTRDLSVSRLQPGEGSQRTAAGSLGGGVQNLPAIVPWWEIFPDHPALVPDMEVPAEGRKEAGLIFPEGFSGTGVTQSEALCLCLSFYFLYFVLESNCNRKGNQGAGHSVTHLES